MSRTYDLELSCGCLIGTTDDIYMPCLSDNCVADEEYFHPTKQPVQTESGEGLSKDGNCSASSTKAKTGDLISYKCGHNQTWLYTFVPAQKHKRMEEWKNSCGPLGDKTKCWECYAKDSNGDV